MALSGILHSSVNTGKAEELLAVFTAPLEISNEQNTTHADSMSLRRLTSGVYAQRWAVTAGLKPGNGEDNTNTDILIHTTEHGKHSPFYVRMPQIYRDSGYASGTTSVLVAADAGGDTISVPYSALISKGTFINVGQKDKVYLVKNVINNPLSGTSSLVLLPSLTGDIVQGDVVRHGDYCSIKCYYDTESHSGIKFIDGVLSDMGVVKLVEAL